ILLGRGRRQRPVVVRIRRAPLPDPVPDRLEDLLVGHAAALYVAIISQAMGSVGPRYSNAAAVGAVCPQHGRHATRRSPLSCSGSPTNVTPSAGLRRADRGARCVRFLAGMKRTS